MRSFATLAAVAALVGFGNADLSHSEKAAEFAHSNDKQAANNFGCDNLKPRLTREDCQYMSSIGMRDQGENSLNPNGKAWIGNQGPYTFKFVNNARDPVTLILWTMENDKDYQAMCVNVRAPKISVSLPRPGDSITISLAENVAGAFSTLDGRGTRINGYGQVDETWGEFNTAGNWATVDVSREVNSRGRAMEIRASNGCVSNMDTCVFVCNDPNTRTCGAGGSYHLQNCGGGNPGAHTDNGVNGGCGGWGNNGKHLDVLFR